jgi:hypothetical protein
MKRFATGLLAIAACVPIHQRETFTDKPVEPDIQRRVVDGSRTYSIDPSIDGHVLSLRIEQSDVCEVKTVPRSRRTRHIERTADGKMMGMLWVAAAGSALLGAYLYLDADSLSAEDEAMDPSDYMTPDEYRGGGVTLVGLGIGSGSIAIVDSIRAIDGDADGGIVEGNAERTEVACRQSMTTGASFVVVLADGVVLRAMTDDEGVAAIDLAEIPLAALPERGGAITAKLGERDVRIELGISDVEEIRTALLGDPESRVSRELAAQRRAVCAGAITGARARSRAALEDDPDSAVAGWDTAREQCADLWTADNEMERTQAHADARASRCAIALRAGAALIGEPLSRESLVAATNAVDTANEVCDAQRVGQIKALRTKVDAATRQLEKREEDDARIANLMTVMGDIEEALANEDPQAAYVLVKATPGVKKVLSSPAEDLVWANLQVAVDNVLASNPSRKEAAVRMCYARKVFQALVGQGELRRAVQRFVDRVGTHDPAQAARVVKAVKAGSCR